MKTKLLFSFDDGSDLDRKLIEVLNRYYCQATFFVPIESWGFNNIKIYQNHDIGCHTRTHPSDLKLLSPKELYDEIVTPRIILGIKSGKKIKDFCYPRGRYNEQVIEYVNMGGYRYARTTKVLHTSKRFDKYEMPTTIHIYPDRKEYLNRGWVSIAHEILDSEPEYFHVWGHANEIEEYAQWQDFEELLSRLLKDGFINFKDRENENSIA